MILTAHECNFYSRRKNISPFTIVPAHSQQTSGATSAVVAAKEMEEANGSGGEGDIGGLGESEDRRHFLIRVKKYLTIVNRCAMKWCN